MQKQDDVQPVRDNQAPQATPTSPSLLSPAELAASFFPAGNCGMVESRRFTVQEVIGKGSYGIVCAALDNLTGQRVAIKRIQNVFEHVADATRILREIKLLRLLKHPDVVEIKHIMLPPDPRTYKDIYVVFELMESDLHTVIGANDDLTADHHKVRRFNDKVQLQALTSRSFPTGFSLSAAPSSGLHPRDWCSSSRPEAKEHPCQ